MKRNQLITMLLLLVFVFTGCQGNATAPANKVEGEGQNEIDDRFILVESDGTEVILDKTPERIVVLSVATAEIIHSLGIEIVGITTTSRELSEGLRNLPDVGIPMTPDMERITALNPDLVIMSTNFKAAHKDSFAQFNLPTYFIDNQRYTDTQRSIEMLAKAFGKEDKVDEILKPIKAREEAVLNSIKDKEGPRVMVMFGASDSFSMARDNSYAGEMVKILGGTNITDSLKVDDGMASMIPLSIEEAVKFNPQIILRISHGNPRQVQRLYDQEFASNAIWNDIDAVKDGRVYDLSTELYFANPGLTAIDALEELTTYLYPEM